MKDCIWNSFLASKRRHLLLTGGRGSGKTTVLGQLFGTPHITTWAVPGEGVYLRFGGQVSQIGVFDPRLPGPENRMAPLPLGFPDVSSLANGLGEWVSVDEVGYLDLACPAYLEKLWQLGQRKRLALAVRKEVADRVPLEDVFRVDLDAPAGDTGCVIMASGLGKRFGSNKLLANFRGEPLVQQILRSTADFPRRVVVTRHREVEALCRSQGIPCLLHDLPHRSDTVRLGLEALAGVQRCLFCPGDQPLLRRETVLSLALLGQNEEAIWRPRCQGMPGAPVLFPQWAFSQLLTLPQGMGGGAVVKKYPDRVRYLDIADPLELQDADTPQGLGALEGRV